MTPYGNIGLGQCWLREWLGTVSIKPLPEPMLIYHQRCFVVFTSEQFHTKSAPELDTLGQRQDGRRFTYDIFKCIFLNETVQILIKISMKFVPKCSINNIPALVQIMPWCHPGDKPLSERTMFSLPTHICVTRPQWVKLYARRLYFIITTRYTRGQWVK